MIIPFSSYYFYNLDDLHFFAWDFFGGETTSTFPNTFMYTEYIKGNWQSTNASSNTIFFSYIFVQTIITFIIIHISPRNFHYRDDLDRVRERKRESEIEEIWIHWWVLTLMGSFYSHIDLCRSIIENESMNKKEMCLYRKLTKGKW